MKKLLALVLCFVLIAALVGCTNNGTFNTEDWADMEITVAGYRLFNDDPLNYEFAAGAEKFTEEYGTTVTFMIGGGGTGLGNDLVAAVVAGDPWEVQYAFGISGFPLTFTQELYTPITEYIDFETNDLIDKITVDGTYWQGEYYGVSSLPMQEAWYIAYNETWMKELGLKTPYEYYEEGNWTMDSYKELNAKAKALGASSYSRYDRPHVGGMYMSTLNADTGEFTVTYDSEENYQWLNFWGALMTDPQYDIEGKGRVSSRELIMTDEVMPNLIKDELTVETKDTIRYIHFPNMDGELGVYLTDSHFLFPAGVAEDKLPCAIMLACYMTDMKSQMVTDSTYKPNMTEEDFALFQENLNNAYYIPRLFYDGVFAIGNTFYKDMKEGKSVATHIAENTESLKAKALEFNQKYVDGFEG